MVKGIAAVIAGLVLAVIVGIVLVAIGKFLLGIALVVGLLLIAGLVLAGMFGSKFLDLWKSF